MPFGYHSSTKPGSAQLEVPTVIRPMADRLGPDARRVDAPRAGARGERVPHHVPETSAGGERERADRAGAAARDPLGCAEAAGEVRAHRALHVPRRPAAAPPRGDERPG